MCAARERRRFNGLCDTCCWLGHLSCDCLVQRDRIYSDVPTLSSPPISPPSYSGRTGAPGYDIPCSPPQYSSSHCYRAKPFVRRYSGGGGTALLPHQQPAPRPFSSFVRDQRYYDGSHSAAPPQQQAPRPFSSFVRDQRYNGGHSTAPPQQPAPRQRRRSSHAPAPSLALAGTRCTLATVDRRSMLDLRITLRRGKRSGMLVWTTEQSNNGPRRR